MTFEERQRLLTSKKQFELKAEHLPYATLVIGVVIAFAVVPIIKKRIRRGRK